MKDEMRPVWWTDEVERRHLSAVRDGDEGRDCRGWTVGHGYWCALYRWHGPYRGHPARRTFSLTLGRVQFHTSWAVTVFHRDRKRGYSV